MALIVQKYGGSSVADAESIRRVAKRIVDARRAGHDVVVAVSAMGDTTDELLDLASQVSPLPAPRELDMLLSSGERISMALLAMAINSMGFEARSFTGSQAGMITDSSHGAARIVDVTPVRVREALDEGAIVIVAGFQGFSRDTRDITTLGRGGSDTTAVALAAALNADVCEIYSDVDGIFTADPRVVPKARKLATVQSEEMLELAANGAKVLYIRAVEFARRHGVMIHARSTFSSGVGTYVLGPGMTAPDHEEGEEMEEPIVTGVATDLSQAKITVVGVPDVPGKAAEIFKIVAKSGANVDMIVQNVSAAATGRTDISFTLPKAEASTALRALSVEQGSVGFDKLVHDDQIGKLSVVGAGMRTHSGVSATLFEALSTTGVNIEMISTSEIRISVVVRGDDLAEAARVVHTAYGLDGDTEAVVHAGTGR
ncbi:aspartate kinase [Microbacterium sp. CnD16-F]|uniref:Aspartokinase n=2 Tax=Microbacterium TaxID=33882 RepID=A0A177K8R8_9MICO|nr:MULTISPECIES: aspartate kinase [Microbacterium]MCM3697241.1 aspartate kinase [Microbacterium oleivorans]MCO7204311.1 aspartate kinase [Microbacterium sp. CnD16-F]MDT0181101.1 aspartate kinase [Microbacterium sp. ARD31]MDT3315412.1 aspartate kinase [Microbacterium sp. KSW4-11]OAH49799.1 aspartate kinase [Microbacterium oleivorans]